VQELHKAAQYIHCRVTHQFTGKAFYITYVYGANQEATRRELWEALESIAETMDEAWCVLGDFNAVLYPEDRRGGTAVQDFEVRPFLECLTNCELREARYRRPYYSWTDQTVWTRIDRVFINTLWYDIFDFCQTAYLPSSLSDHIPMLLETPTCPVPPKLFHFCDMWVRDPDFLPMIQACFPGHSVDPWPTLARYHSRRSDIGSAPCIPLDMGIFDANNVELNPSLHPLNYAFMRRPLAPTLRPKSLTLRRRIFISLLRPWS